ncbi:MAG: hypothetical protein ACP5H2_07130 [Solirubrobacteraceae bacterium]
MALLDLPPVRPTRRRSNRSVVTGGGTSGNQQLTAVVGSVLLVLFAILGVSILRIGQLLWLHMFIGIVLAGPVGLKIASTGYRFVRYYTGDPAYKRKGPPPPVLRALGPLVVLATLAMLITGLALLLAGPTAPIMLRNLHKLSFVAWFLLMSVHVLAHVGDLPHAVRAVRRAEQRAYRRTRISYNSRRLPGSVGRNLLVFGSLAFGLLLAILLGPEIHNWVSHGLFYGPQFRSSTGH